LQLLKDSDSERETIMLSLLRTLGTSQAPTLRRQPASPSFRRSPLQPLSRKHPLSRQAFSTMSLRKEVQKDVLHTVQQASTKASTKRKTSWLVRVKAVLVVGGIGCGGGVAGGALGGFSVWEYKFAPKIRALKDRHTCAMPTNSTPLREPDAKSSPTKPHHRIRIVPLLYHSLPEER
jgi:hypothetical protein